MTGFPLLGRILRSTALRWALVALLLAAQQSALTHALSHAGGHAHETAVSLHEQVDAHEHGVEKHHHDEKHDDPGRTFVSEQCAFDLVYSQVLAALHAGHGVHFAATDAVAPVAVVLRPRTATTTVPYDSRGPPAFS
jgi:hypothetical protein